MAVRGSRWIRVDLPIYRLDPLSLTRRPCLPIGERPWHPSETDPSGPNKATTTSEAGEAHGPIYIYGRLMCWRRHGAQLTPWGRRFTPRATRSRKAGGRGYRRVLAEVSGTHLEMIAGMFSTKSREVKVESIL